MGQQTTTIHFPKMVWYEIKKQENSIIFYNDNGLYAQKKLLIQNKKMDATEELKIYKERFQVQLPIVKVFSAAVQQQKKNFCSTLQKLVVWIEYIPNRLKSIKSFSLSELESLYILQQSVKSFHQLFKKFGYFQIKAEMIGFNTEGQVKCWINKNFESNRIENENGSIFSGNGNQLKIYEKMDHNLRESIEKGMVCDIWRLVKRKANIEKRDFFQKLEVLECSNFANAQILLHKLIQNNKNKIPSCLYFENCIQLKSLRFRQFNYSEVYTQENSKIKIVQISEPEIMKNGTFNFDVEDTETNFKNFDEYRKYIQFISRRQLQKQCGVSMSFGIREPKINLTQFNKLYEAQSLNSKASFMNNSKLIEKTINNSFTSINLSPSQKTIQASTEPTIKKIQSEQVLFVPFQTVIKSDSIFVPRVTTQRYILNQVCASNLPSSRVISPTNNKTIQTNRLLGSPKNSVLMVENRQPVIKNTFSRYLSPQKIPGSIRKQYSAIKSPKQPGTPKFNRMKVD